MQEEQKTFKQSWFFKWLLDNKLPVALLVVFLLLLNILLLSQLSFLFVPIGQFLGVIMLPIVLAGIFFYMLNPIVDYFEQKKVHRVISISILFVMIAGLLVWGLAIAIPSLIEQVENFAKNFPQYVTGSEKQLRGLLADERFKQVRPYLETYVGNFSDKLIEWSKILSANFVSGVGGFISKMTSVLLAVIIFPFVLFYLLRDGKRLNSYVTSFLPNAWRKDTATLLTQVNSQLANYIRGQLTVAIIVAIMFAVLFKIIGLQYAFGLAASAGFLNLIPYLGSFLAMIPAVIIAIMAGPWMLVKVLVVFMVEQTIEGRFVSPQVLGSKLNIHPIVILFILLTSGKLFGFWGVLIGIPVYAVLKVIVVYVYQWYRKISSLYPEDGLSDGGEA